MLLPRTRAHVRGARRLRRHLRLLVLAQTEELNLAEVQDHLFLLPAREGELEAAPLPAGLPLPARRHARAEVDETVGVEDLERGPRVERGEHAELRHHEDG